MKDKIEKIIKELEEKNANLLKNFPNNHWKNVVASIQVRQRISSNEEFIKQLKELL